MNRSAVLLIALAGVAESLALASPPDCASWKVRDVRLGMTPDEVHAAVKTEGRWRTKAPDKDGLFEDSVITRRGGWARIAIDRLTVYYRKDSDGVLRVAIVHFQPWMFPKEPGDIVAALRSTLGDPENDGRLERSSFGGGLDNVWDWKSEPCDRWVRFTVMKSYGMGGETRTYSIYLDSLSASRDRHTASAAAAAEALGLK